MQLQTVKYTYKNQYSSKAQLFELKIDAPNLEIALERAADLIDSRMYKIIK